MWYRQSSSGNIDNFWVYIAVMNGLLKSKHAATYNLRINLVAKEMLIAVRVFCWTA
jgi:hypothetical protein